MEDEKTIFQQIKEQIDQREFISYFLGEPPLKSGDNWFWHSPFNVGDNQPSFCASPEQITDFSSDDTFGRGQDIFDFIVKYNSLTHCISNFDLNNYDALNWVNEHYNLGYDLSSMPNNSNNKKEEIADKVKSSKKCKTLYSLETVENATKAKTEGIITFFDNVSFKSKPEPNDVKKIRNRTVPNGSENYTLEEIKNNLICGHTCIPAAIKSKKQWLDGESNYQMFLLDFDNSIMEDTIDETTGKKVKKKKDLTVDDERHITFEKVLEYCKEKSIIPTFAYSTFSHSEQQHKFRLVYILDEPVHCLEEILGVYKTFKDIFQDYHIDTSTTDIARLFYGGQEIIFESESFYKVVSREIEEEIEKEEFQYSEIEQQCNKYLKYTPYEARNKHLGYTTKNGGFTTISNFIPYCTNKLTYVNGNDRITKYEMNCELIDTPHIKLPSLIIDVNSYSKCDFIIGSSWDKHCILSAGNGNTARLREAMQNVSRQTMNEKTIYTHTGFRRIDNNLCYLCHGGVIGNVENVETDLSGDKLQQYCFTDKECDTSNSIKRSLSSIEVADYSITMPLLATIYLAPLKSLLAENNIFADCIVFVQGQSGVRKSSLVAALMSHFGKFNRDTFPCSFRDTINSIEKKTYLIKDSVIVVDDYNPETVGTAKLGIMEKLYGTFGDRTGRTRMSQDGQTLKEPYIARGLCIVTGEMLPEVAQSRIARSLIVTIEKDSIDLDKLSELQENTEELAYAMKHYIKWIIENEESVIEYAKKEFKNNQKLQNVNNEVHGRTKEIANILPIGFTLFTLFAYQQGVISEQEKIKLDNNMRKALNTLTIEQTQQVKELKPTEMFYNALEELLQTNTIRVTDVSRNLQIGDGREVGFYSSERKVFYLYQSVIFNEISRFYNNKFPIPQNTLWKYMVEEGFLYRTDDKRYKVSRTIFGKTMSVLEIKDNNINIPKPSNMYFPDPHKQF